MTCRVQKYGGTSVAGPDRLRQVAARVVAARRAGHQVIAVVSAMGSTTDEMIALARQVNPAPPQRELDMLVTAGERVTMALLAMAIDTLGERAISFTGSQSGIITSSSHGNARIEEVRPFRIREALDDGWIVIVAGYQGVSREKEITTLGRGGTDLTAVALAAAFDARCELYKDVPGILSADPRHIPDARLHREVPAAAMVAYAAAGAGVLYDEAVRFARDRGVEVWVGSSLVESTGTQLRESDVPDEFALGVALANTADGTVVTAVGGAAWLSRLDTALGEAPIGIDSLTRQWFRASADDAVVLARRIHDLIASDVAAPPPPPAAPS